MRFCHCRPCGSANLSVLGRLADPGTVYSKDANEIGTTRDFHLHVLAIHGYYDWRVLVIAGAICSQGDTIVEVGANVGTETLGFADIVGVGAHS